MNALVKLSHGNYKFDDDMVSHVQSLTTLGIDIKKLWGTCWNTYSGESN